MFPAFRQEKGAWDAALEYRADNPVFVVALHEEVLEGAVLDDGHPHLEFLGVDEDLFHC